MSNSLTLLISSERPEQIAHGRSFPLSDLSDLLMVAHMSWAIWANRSQSLIWFERNELNERMSDERFPALLIGGDVVAHWLRCCWFIGGDAVAHWWRCGSSWIRLYLWSVTIKCEVIPVVTSWPLVAGLQLVELLWAGGRVLLRVVPRPRPDQHRPQFVL